MNSFDSASFYQKLKSNKLFSSFSQLQVDSINATLQEIDIQGITDNRQKAYIFATGYHEGFDYDGASTGKKQRFVPITEKGSMVYLKSKEYYPWIGEGLVMITWERNYKKFQAIIEASGRFPGVNILKNTKQALIPSVAAFIMVYGMKHGTFTTKSLDMYFNTIKTDPESARRIVNGTDKAKTIASYYYKFLECF